MARARQEVAPENRLARFWRETISELRKVVWPTWEQALNLTIIVVVTLVVMAAFLGLADLMLNNLAKLILTR